MSAKIKDILLITEGGAGIGLGHLMRCVGIAQYARDLKIKPFFIVKGNKTISDLLKKYQFDVKRISSIDNGVMKHLDGFEGVPAVIDSKKNLSVLINQLKSKGCKIALIDNITDARLSVDSVIYPNEHFEPDFLSWEEAQGKVYHGAKYLPIRKELKQIKKKRRNSKKHSILISFGGADPNSLTLKVIRAMKDVAGMSHVKILLGPIFNKKDKDKIIREAKYLKGKVEVIEDDYKPNRLFKDIDICITALGISLYEFNYLRIPTLLLCNYQNDERESCRLERLNIVKSLGYYKDVSLSDIRRGIGRFIEEKKETRRHVDGKGAERIVSLLFEQRYG